LGIDKPVKKIKVLYLTQCSCDAKTPLIDSISDKTFQIFSNIELPFGFFPFHGFFLSSSSNNFNKLSTKITKSAKTSLDWNIVKANRNPLRACVNLENDNSREKLGNVFHAQF